MKIRMGFVSNSSSSSFVIPTAPANKECLENLDLYNDDDDDNDTYTENTFEGIKRYQLSKIRKFIDENLENIVLKNQTLIDEKINSASDGEIFPTFMQSVESLLYFRKSIIKFHDKYPEGQITNLLNAEDFTNGDLYWFLEDQYEKIADHI